MKTLIEFKTRVSELNALRAHAEALGLSLAATLRDGCQQCLDHPQGMIKVFAHIIALPTAPSGPLAATTLRIEPELVQQLDLVADKLCTTRNGLLQIITRGILGGVIIVEPHQLS